MEAGSSKVDRQENGEKRHQRPESSILRRRLTHIPARQPVLLRLPNKKLKSVELHPGKIVSLGKYGSFRSDDIIGLPFGLTFEVVTNCQGAEASSVPTESNTGAPTEKAGKKQRNKGQSAQADVVGDLKVVLNTSVSEVEDNQATNEMIRADDADTQTLTYLDIRALKDSGIQGREIVQREVASNSTFQQRTSWSQQKFVMRKEAKHVRLFTPVPPTLTNIVQYIGERFDNEANDKIRGLRSDSLSSMLSLVGVAPGRKFIVVDGVGGLLAGAMLERMGGEGRLLALNDSDSPPPFDVMPQFTLSSSTIDPVLRSMHWACTDPEWVSPLAPTDSEEVTPAGKPANDRDRQRFRKRRAAHTKLENVRKELFEGDFDGLIIASGYEPCSMIERLLPYLGGSSNIVVHSPYLQPLIEAHVQLRAMHSLVNVSVTEPWQRRYQVLPGRMHPEMMTSASAGYILHGIRVLTEEDTSRAMSNQSQDLQSTHQAKRVRVDNDSAGSSFSNEGILYN